MSSAVRQVMEELEGLVARPVQIVEEHGERRRSGSEDNQVADRVKELPLIHHRSCSRTVPGSTPSRELLHFLPGTLPLSPDTCRQVWRETDECVEEWIVQRL